MFFALSHCISNPLTSFSVSACVILLSKMSIWQLASILSAYMENNHHFYLEDTQVCSNELHWEINGVTNLRLLELFQFLSNRLIHLSKILQLLQ